MAPLRNFIALNCCFSIFFAGDFTFRRRRTSERIIKCQNTLRVKENCFSMLNFMQMSNNILWSVAFVFLHHIGDSLLGLVPWFRGCFIALRLLNRIRYANVYFYNKHNNVSQSQRPKLLCVTWVSLKKCLN